MCPPPVERFKSPPKNWRYNPFTSADMAIDAEEDGLIIPAGAPFVVQLLEVPRKNTPTSVLVRAYDTETDVDADSASGQKVLNVTATTGFSASDKVVINRGGAREEEGVIDTIQAGVSLTLLVNLTYTHTATQGDAVEKYIEFTEVITAPTQSQFRVDYPPADGEGTGLIELNQNDASKEIRVNYKATGSPALEEYFEARVPYPAGDPVDNQIIAFDTGAPTWKYNPRPYFHEGPVIYNAAGEDESCLLFRFKRRAEDQKVYLELKGAKLHQGLYTELAAHDHGVGTLAAVAVGDHDHPLSGLQIGQGGDHGHGVGTLAAASGGGHSHAKGTLAGSQPTHMHSIAGRSHRHGGVSSGAVNTDYANGCNSPSGADGNDPVTITGVTSTTGAHPHTITGEVAAVGTHSHSASGGTIGDAGAHGHTLSGTSASQGVAAKTYPDQLKVYVNSVDKTAEILALTGLTQFGDSTAGHAFVTTGSGEMDISSLVAAAQMHELKITEPISAKGGRCLLHIEIY